MNDDLMRCRFDESLEADGERIIRAAPGLEPTADCPPPSYFSQKPLVAAREVRYASHIKTGCPYCDRILSLVQKAGNDLPSEQLVVAADPSSAPPPKVMTQAPKASHRRHRSLRAVALAASIVVAIAGGIWLVTLPTANTKSWDGRSAHAADADRVNADKDRLPIEPTPVIPLASPAVAGVIGETGVRYTLSSEKGRVPFSAASERRDIPIGERLVGVVFFGKGRVPLLRGFLLLRNEEGQWEGETAFPEEDLRKNGVPGCEQYRVSLVSPESLTEHDVGPLLAAMVQDAAHRNTWLEWFAACQGRMEPRVANALVSTLR